MHTPLLSSRFTRTVKRFSRSHCEPNRTTESEISVTPGCRITASKISFYEGKSISKLQTVIEKKRMGIMTYKQHLFFNPLKPELNPICYLLALLAQHFLHVSRIRVKSLTLRRLMSYIYMEHPFLMFLDHTQRRSTVGRTPLDE